MFELSRTIARNAQSDLEDSKNVKMALTSLGYYDDTESGLSPYGDDQLFESIKDFQKDNDLKVDGVMKPKGPTEVTMKAQLEAVPQAAGAFFDFTKNYFDMRMADTIDSDKYFHCKANYQATKRGWLGRDAAERLSNAREVFGKYVKGDPDSDRMSDQKANKYGRQSAISGNYRNAEEACAIFRPKGLDKKY